MAPLLNRAQRARLTLAMLHDVLEQLAQVKDLAGIVVLSNDENVIELAGQLNVRIWLDNANDLNLGLQAVKKGLAAEGFGVMIIPCDVPVVRAQDYQQLLAAHREGVTLVEASADGGTNALLCDADIEVTFHYGSGSFAAHKQVAEKRSMTLTVVKCPHLQRDIDRPEDLDWLVSSSDNCRARDYILQLFPEMRQVDWKLTA